MADEPRITSSQRLAHSHAIICLNKLVFSTTLNANVGGRHQLPMWEEGISPLRYGCIFVTHTTIFCWVILCLTDYFVTDSMIDSNRSGMGKLSTHWLMVSRAGRHLLIMP
jgi:hypothetical protein